jgi:acetoin utilization protein AcuC
VNRGSHASQAEEAVIVVHGPSLTSYTFSDEHPLQPSRHALTMSLLSALGWLDRSSVWVEEPRPAGLSVLLTAHALPYIQAVQAAQAVARGERPPVDLRIFGLGSEDCPLFPSIHDASALLAGATHQAVLALVAGRAVHAYSPAGGMHHAMRARASGFCIYNDIVVAIGAAIGAGMRVAYVDFDAHHGDGVQAAFYEDPRVLTISIHESGRFLFPGTGEATETGAGDAVGTCVNVPLPPDSGNDAILSALDRVVCPAVEAFAPDLVVTQTGCDTHHDDPLTDLAADMTLYPELAARMHALVHRASEGRWLIVGGGGYDPADVTPRAWTAFFGTVLGQDPGNVSLPEEWKRESRARGGDPPERLLDDPGTPAGGAPDPAFARTLAEIEAGPLWALRARFSRS